MLYLWMPEANGVWQWSQGEQWNQVENLEQLIQTLQLFQGQEATVFFPSRDVQMIQQQMSKTQYKQLGVEGVQYLLEEYVIVPIDQMKVLSHFQAPDQLTILGIAQSTLQTMQHSLDLLPVQVVALLPDFLLLPEPSVGQIQLAQFQHRVLIRESTLHGRSVDDLALYLDLVPLAEHYGYSQLDAQNLQSLSALTTAEQRQQMDNQFIVPLKPKQHPLNVLPKVKNRSSRWSGYWQACALLLLALLLVQFSFDAVRWFKLKKVADQTAAISLQQYQGWFGANARLNEQNIKSLFESNLRLSQAANTQALDLISRLGPILMQQQVVANRVSYEANVLSLDLVAQSNDVLQRLVSQLNQQGFKAQLGSIQSQGEAVVGMVKVQ